MTQIPLTSTRTARFTPPSLAGTKIKFELIVPSYVDRDEIGVILYQMGCKNVTEDELRATMISELFRMRGPEGADKADEDAMFLEGHWSQENLDKLELQQWAAQQRENIADRVASGGAVEPVTITPPDPRTTLRQRSRASMIVQEVLEGSALVRDRIASQSSYDSRYYKALVQLHLVSVAGLDVAIEREQGLVTDETLELLRDKLTRQSHTAWRELGQEINGFYDLPAVERGNLDSPPANTSHQSGSQTGSGGGKKTGGNSRTGTRATRARARSSSSLTPADGSQTTTATS